MSVGCVTPKCVCYQKHSNKGNQHLGQSLFLLENAATSGFWGLRSVFWIGLLVLRFDFAVGSVGHHRPEAFVKQRCQGRELFGLVEDQVGGCHQHRR